MMDPAPKASSTMARQVAQETGVPAVERDVFLDSDPEPQAVRAQFRRLLKLARKQGFALGIGHPYDSTLDVLESELFQLEQEGIRLVAVSELIELDKRRGASWQVSWYR